MALLNLLTQPTVIFLKYKHFTMNMMLFYSSILGGAVRREVLACYTKGPTSLPRRSLKGNVKNLQKFKLKKFSPKCQKVRTVTTPLKRGYLILITPISKYSYHEHLMLFKANFQLTHIWMLKEIKVRRLELLGKLMLETTPHSCWIVAEKSIWQNQKHLQRLSSLVLQCIVKLLIIIGIQKMPYKSCFFQNISSRPQLKIFGYIFPKILCINTSDFQLILIYYS